MFIFQAWKTICKWVQVFKGIIRRFGFEFNENFEILIDFYWWCNYIYLNENYENITENMF